MRWCSLLFVGLSLLGKSFGGDFAASSRTATYSGIVGEGRANQFAGSALAISGDTLFVGAPGYDLHAQYSGCVYQYRLSGGTFPVLEDVIVPSTPGPGQQFGSSLVSDAGRLFVGAPGVDEVHVVNTNGVFLGPLVSTNSSGFGRFGAVLAVDGDWIAVGAPDEEVAGAFCGEVSLFRETIPGQWHFHSALIPDEPDDGLLFGSALSLWAGGWRLGRTVQMGGNRSSARYMYTGIPPTQTNGKLRG